MLGGMDPTLVAIPNGCGVKRNLMVDLLQGVQVKKPMLIGKFSFGVCEHEGKVYVVGGQRTIPNLTQ